MENSKLGQHISEPFNKELEDIRNKVLNMGGLVEQQIELAVEAFSTGNLEMAERVLSSNITRLMPLKGLSITNVLRFWR